MVSTKKLACPFCDVRLKVTCPKCGEGFPVPDPRTLSAPATTPGEGKVGRAPKVGTASSSYSFSSAGGAAKVKGARKAAPRPDDRQDEEMETPPKPRKRRKKAEEPASNAPLVWGLVIGGAVSLIVGVILAVIFRPWEKKAEAVAVSDPARRAATESVSAPVALRPGPRGRGPRAEPGPAAQQPVAERGPSGQASAGAGSDLIAAGQSVYQANNCARCHALGGGGAGRRGSKGPDLSRVGAERTVDWLVEQIREPRSHKPDSRMPSYGDKISEDDLRAVASYLASLK